jgi:4-hydroxy-tetrahydrodipicolinate synthase
MVKLTKLLRLMKIIKNKPNDFIIISGDDDLVLDATLAGGSGVISVIGQAFPKEFSQMIQLGLQGNRSEAKAIEARLMEVIGLIFEENNPSGIKAVFESLGLCADTVRLPLVPASDALKTKIATFITNF